MPSFLRSKVCFISLCLIGCAGEAASQSLAAPLPTAVFAVKAGHLVDPANSSVVDNQIILVRAGQDCRDWLACCHSLRCNGH